jgi:hypothetical protein
MFTRPIKHDFSYLFPTDAEIKLREAQTQARLARAHASSVLETRRRVPFVDLMFPPQPPRDDMEQGAH